MGSSEGFSHLFIFNSDSGSSRMGIEEEIGSDMQKIQKSKRMIGEPVPD